MEFDTQGSPVHLGKELYFDYATLFTEEHLSNLLMIYVVGPANVIGEGGTLGFNLADEEHTISAFVLGGPARGFVTALSNFLDRHPEIV